MLVEDFLEQSTQATPDKIAVVCGDQRSTYKDLDQLCNQVAHALIAAGVGRGDRVAVLLPNSIEAVISIFGTLKADGVFVAINPSTKIDKLRYILNDCRITGILTYGSRVKEIADHCAELAHLKLIVSCDPAESCEEQLLKFGKQLLCFDSPVIKQSPKTPPIRRSIDIDLAALIYTSGSTGRPKGVMLTHLNIVSASTSITTYLENTPDDVILNVLPLSFDYGLYQVLMSFKIGGKIILEQSFGYPIQTIRRIIQHNVTGFPLVPTMAAMILQMDLSKFRFPHLRYITNTAASLPVDHIKRLRKAFPGASIYSMYGLTECKRVSYLPPAQLNVRPTSVGKGMPNEEVYIVDDRGSRVAPGVVGELVVRGSNVMKGYWELPGETERMLRPGPLPGDRVLYTGDLFRSDEEGYLYFVGRKDDIIKTKGEKVSPREVEDAIYSLDGVIDVAVIGVPDPVLGEAIKAIVSVGPDATITERDILRRCRERLEDFMIPKSVQFQSALPKTDSGKISKHLVRMERASQL